MGKTYVANGNILAVDVFAFAALDEQRLAVPSPLFWCVGEVSNL